MDTQKAHGSLAIAKRRNFFNNYIWIWWRKRHYLSLALSRAFETKFARLGTCVNKTNERVLRLSLAICCWKWKKKRGRIRRKNQAFIFIHLFFCIICHVYLYILSLLFFRTLLCVCVCMCVLRKSANGEGMFNGTANQAGNKLEDSSPRQSWIPQGQHPRGGGPPGLQHCT